MLGVVEITAEHVFCSYNVVDHILGYIPIRPIHGALACGKHFA